MHHQFLLWMWFKCGADLTQMIFWLKLDQDFLAFDTHAQCPLPHFMHSEHDLIEFVWRMPSVSPGLPEAVHLCLQKQAR